MEYTIDSDIDASLELGEPDTRPRWAKRLNPYHSNWALIERVQKACQQAGVELTEDSAVELKTVALQMERSYLTTVFADGKEVGNYKY